MLEFAELLKTQGKDACKSSTYEAFKLQVELIYLENKTNNKGYISKKTAEAAKKLERFCSSMNFLD